MKFEKPDPEVIDFFEGVAPGPEQGAEKRKMFGYPCRFANGNMFMGVHNNHIVLRLPAKDRERFLKLPGGRLFEPMPGRVMKEYVVVPQKMHESLSELGDWMDRSLAYAKNLPAKEKGEKKGKEKEKSGGGERKKRSSSAAAGGKNKRQIRKKNK